MRDFNQQPFVRRFDRTDAAITGWMARHGIQLLRISIGIVFIWFGALKFFPGASPAEDLIRTSLGGFLPMDLFLPFLALWEVVIGLGFLTGRFMRFTLLILALQMIGTLSPIVLQPDRVWRAFPFVLTLEGQYMIKNMVLVSGALVIGATVRGGGLKSAAEDEGAG